MKKREKNRKVILFHLDQRCLPGKSICKVRNGSDACYEASRGSFDNLSQESPTKRGMF